MSEVTSAARHDPMLTRQGVADLLGVSEWLVRGFERNGIPLYRFGGDVRFHRAEVLRWWRNGRRSAGAPGISREELVAAIREALAGLRLAPIVEDAARLPARDELAQSS